MDLADLFKKHHEELKNFATLRDNIWAEMKERHNNLISAFGNFGNLPDYQQNQINREILNYHEEWALETGTRFKDIIAQHEKQRNNITGNKPEPKPQKEQPKAQNDNLSDKQAKLANLIKVQKAIAAKKMQNKPRH